MNAHYRPLTRHLSFSLAALLVSSMFLAGLRTSSGSPFQQEDQTTQDQQAKMEKQRRDDAFQKLKEDTQKLHEGAGELKEMIEKSNAHTFSLQIIKKTEELERLLKEIKRRTKEGL